MAEYGAIDKVEIKSGFALGAIIGSIILLVFAIGSMGAAAPVLILIPLLLFIGFGTNVVITCKDKSKISFMSGKLDGETRQNLIAELNKKFSKA